VYASVFFCIECDQYIYADSSEWSMSFRRQRISWQRCVSRRAA